MIRKAEFSDIGRLAALERENFSDAWNENMLSDELNNPHAAVFVSDAGMDGGIISYACLRGPVLRLGGCRDAKLEKVAENNSIRTEYCKGGDCGEKIKKNTLCSVCGEGEILRIATDNAFRRHGYAEEMLFFIIEYLKSVGAGTVFLEVRFDNTAAKTLYEKHGFRKIAERKKYYGDEADADVYKLETWTPICEKTRI
ncbi:MAG: GNAT family N-acetyltransferase [Clostridiales bacterium]|jgi:ribosomal protein S18 acetylase RimI-like enzyme|nr:GNAT family N-acetyltransferase [Clostridiales bacterium]